MDVNAVLENNIIAAAPKVLWLRLYNRYGYKRFIGSYEEMGKEMGLNRYTARSQIAALKKAGAIEVGRFFDEDRTDDMGNSFKLIRMEKWHA